MGKLRVEGTLIVQSTFCTELAFLPMTYEGILFRIADSFPPRAHFF